MDKDEEGKSITKKSGEDIEQQNANPNANAWYSSGSKWKDYLYFCGPGWFVAIAYIDPGNTQADIQAGAVSGFYQLWTFLWVTVLSIYVQVLCARLAMIGQTTLAESMKKVLKHKPLILIAWIIAEFSVIITDLPEVIGIGIAFNVFFGWPYWVGVLISPVTTMLFLATQNMKVSFESTVETKLHILLLTLPLLFYPPLFLFQIRIPVWNASSRRRHCPSCWNHVGYDLCGVGSCR